MIGPGGVGSSEISPQRWADLVGRRVLVKPRLEPKPISCGVVESSGDWVALCAAAPHDQTLGWVPGRSVELLADLGAVRCLIL